MRIVRLSIAESLATCEWIHYRLPVRLGRPPRYGDDSASPEVCLELDWANDRLILRDLGTHRPILVRVADVLQELRGSELTTAATQIEVAIAGVWIRASVEERRVHPIAEAAQAAVDELVGSCAEPASVGANAALAVLAALQRGTLGLRSSLEIDRDGGGAQEEVIAALGRWAQASLVALAFVVATLERAGEAGSSSRPRL